MFQKPGLVPGFFSVPAFRWAAFGNPGRVQSAVGQHQDGVGGKLLLAYAFVRLGDGILPEKGIKGLKRTHFEAMIIKNRMIKSNRHVWLTAFDSLRIIDT